MWQSYQQTAHIFVTLMEESRVDFLWLKRSSRQNKWLFEQEGNIQPVATITQDKPALSIKIKGRPGENEDSLHNLLYSTLLSTSPRKEDMFFLPSMEQQGLSLLGQANICLLVRGDRWGWRGLCLPEPQCKRCDSGSWQEGQVLVQGASKIPSQLLDHKLQHWFKNYTCDFLNHAKNPFPILVLVVVSLLHVTLFFKGYETI